MKRKVEKEAEGGSKKRKEVGNDNSLVSMFAKQEAVIALNKARDAYRIECTASKKGKESAPRRHNKERQVRARMSRRQPSNPSRRLLGLGWSFGQ